MDETKLGMDESELDLDECGLCNVVEPSRESVPTSVSQFMVAAIGTTGGGPLKPNAVRIYVI